MKRIKFNVYFKIIALEILVTFIMSILAPYLLNYPPGSEDKLFQGQIEPITHLQQYIALGSLAIIIYILLIRHLFKDIFKYLKSDSKTYLPEQIQKIREQCFIIPKKLIIVQIIILFLVLMILFVSMNANIRLCFKFLLVYFSFFTVIAIISGILLKTDLNKVIKSTYNINSHYDSIHHKTKFDNNLLYNLLPFFIVTIISITLLGYAKVCDAIGESHYHYYNLYLNSIDTDDVSLSSLTEQLNSIPLMNSDNFYFIYTENNEIYSKENVSASDFFIKYASTYLDNNNGRVYEYYGIEEEGCVKKLVLDNGDTGYVGFKYSTTNSNLIFFFMGISVVAILVYMLILMIWSKNVATNIIEISNNLSEIANKENLDDVKVLPVISSDEIGELTIAFNKIQELTKNNISKIHESQDLLMEKERLASLGQLIGGIAHNLKTPIMSIAGAAEGINDLIKEYDASIGDSEVTPQDNHEIAKDMTTWVMKIKDYTEYMSDVITAVKGQAVTLSSEDSITYTIGELVKRVNILMRHELKNALVNMNVDIQLDENIELKGDVNSIVQVINNMISNAIQSYGGEPNKDIDFIIRKEENSIVFSIKDYGSGMSEEIKSKLFKEMVTTKGKNGTGLGLFMSYSTIRGNFGGNITFESEKGKGTQLNIIIPIA